ncbi:MAG TPA: hypothetical protein VI365_00140 [Trebonia sp.]
MGEEVTAVEVWRRVQALRLVTEALDQVAATPTERSKSVATLGRLVIAHMVMRRLGDDRIDDIASDWDNHLANVPGHVYAAVLDLSGSVRRRLTEMGLRCHARSQGPAGRQLAGPGSRAHPRARRSGIP